MTPGEPHAQPQTGPPRGPATRGKGDREGLEALHGSDVPAIARLRAEHADAPPLGEERLAAVLAGMSAHLAAIHDAEAAAVTRVGAILGG